MTINSRGDYARIVDPLASQLLRILLKSIGAKKCIEVGKCVINGYLKFALFEISNFLNSKILLPNNRNFIEVFSGSLLDCLIPVPGGLHSIFDGLLEYSC